MHNSWLGRQFLKILELLLVLLMISQDEYVSVFKSILNEHFSVNNFISSE